MTRNDQDSVTARLYFAVVIIVIGYSFRGLLVGVPSFVGYIGAYALIGSAVKRLRP